MASREFLETVAAAINVTASSYPNDSKLEQKLMYELKNMTAKAGTATTQAAPATAVRLSGDKNV